MATRKSTQAAPAASVNESTKIVLSPREAFQRAVAVLDDMDSVQEHILSVAVAGAICTDENAILERNLFQVIEKMAEKREVYEALHSCIKTLARCAGLELTEVQS